jgi:hypothetical protein
MLKDCVIQVVKLPEVSQFFAADAVVILQNKLRNILQLALIQCVLDLCRQTQGLAPLSAYERQIAVKYTKQLRNWQRVREVMSLFPELMNSSAEGAFQVVTGGHVVGSATKRFITIANCTIVVRGKFAGMS